jgi:hypothetical protein
MSRLNAATVARNATDTETNLMSGLAKAWFNIDADPAISEIASFNVTSYTDNAVGDYTATYTNAMSSANYTAFAAGRMGTNGTNTTVCALNNSALPFNAASMRLRQAATGSGAGGNSDEDSHCGMAMGDLA